MQPAVATSMLYRYWWLKESTLVTNSDNNKFGDCFAFVSDDIDQLLCQMLEMYPKVAWVYIGYANGAYVGCSTTATSTNYSGTTVSLVDNTTGFAMVEYKYDSTTKKRDTSEVLSTSRSNFDVRTRPWYAQGVEVSIH